MKRAQRKIFNNLILWAFFMSLGSLMTSFRLHAINTDNSPTNLTTTKVSEPETVTYTDQWLCRKSNEVRTLRVEKKQGACVALYNKLGRNQTINSSKNSENCSPIVEKVKGNLESAGWKCKDISDSLITK